MKIDWGQKLSSRKFWTAVAAWATSILGAFNIGDSTIAQVALVIGGVGALCVYMLAEGWTDANRVDTTKAEDK
ncbi:hypothetical protein FACS1894202_00800 [Clostridia bacterium]|nr:hypothetical protein FACS1894202_00800 [Clostridia bacterium]